MNMFSHLIYIIKKCCKVVTLNTICEDNAVTNCITFKHTTTFHPRHLKRVMRYASIVMFSKIHRHLILELRVNVRMTYKNKKNYFPKP